MRQIDCLSVDVLVTLRCLDQGPHNVFCVESHTFYTLWFKKTLILQNFQITNIGQY